MQSKNFLPLSFAGTCLASSYLPVFLKHVEKKYTSEKIETYTTSLGYSITPQYAVLPIFPAFNEVLMQTMHEPFWKKLWKLLTSGLSSFTKREKLNEIKMELNAFVEETKETYKIYQVEHEKILGDIVEDIDIINRKKTLMKDYLLTKLFRILSQMGVNSTFTDLSVEHIDLRNFPIKEDYDIISKQQVEQEEVLASTTDDIIELVQILAPYNLIITRFINGRKIKKLEEKFKDLKLKNDLNSKQMNADLNRIGKLEVALKNVSKIYTDIMDTLMPIMEKLLSELSDDYGNDFSNMPFEKVEAIRNIKNILKDLSEIRIIPKESINKLVDNVVEYNNTLSEKHYELKAEMLKMAI